MVDIPSYRRQKIKSANIGAAPLPVSAANVGASAIGQGLSAFGQGVSNFAQSMARIDIADKNSKDSLARDKMNKNRAIRDLAMEDFKDNNGDTSLYEAEMNRLNDQMATNNSEITWGRESSKLHALESEGKLNEIFAQKTKLDAVKRNISQADVVSEQNYLDALSDPNADPEQVEQREEERRDALGNIYNPETVDAMIKAEQEKGAIQLNKNAVKAAKNIASANPQEEIATLEKERTARKSGKGDPRFSNLTDKDLTDVIAHAITIKGEKETFSEDEMNKQINDMNSKIRDASAGKHIDIDALMDEIDSNQIMSTADKNKANKEIKTFYSTWTSIKTKKGGIDEDIVGVAELRDMAGNAHTPWQQESIRESLKKLFNEEKVSNANYNSIYQLSAYDDNQKTNRTSIENKEFRALRAPLIESNISELLKGISALSAGDKAMGEVANTLEAKRRLQAFRLLQAQENLSLWHKNNENASFDQLSTTARAVQADILGWDENKTLQEYKGYLKSHNVKPFAGFPEATSKPEDYESIGTVMENSKGKRIIYIGNNKGILLNE